MAAKATILAILAVGLTIVVQLWPRSRTLQFHRILSEVVSAEAGNPPVVEQQPQNGV